MKNENDGNYHVKSTFASRYILSKLSLNSEFMFEMEDYTLNDTLIDPVVSEIKFCLLLELFQAGITLTNHLLEKALKYFLISGEIGNEKLSNNVEEINSLWKSASEKYNSESLHVTINHSFEKGIVTNEEKEYLHKARKILRNGFSHADPSLIFDGLTIPVALASFTDPQNIQKTEAIIENIPFIQGIAQAEFAKSHAREYFNFVYSIVQRNVAKANNKIEKSN